MEYLAKVKRTSRSKKNSDQENESSEVWVNELRVRDVKHIERYIDGVTKDRKIELVVGATPTNASKKDVWFYVKWENELSGAWLNSDTMKKKFPQDLIKFYENHLFLS